MATEDLINELLAAGCLKFGQFTLKSGAESIYYIDFRESTHHPKLFKLIVAELVSKVNQIIVSQSFEKVAIVGVPYGVWYITGAVVHELVAHHNRPCSGAQVRKEVKAYGHTSDMNDLKDHRFIVIEDVMSSGSSIMETIEKLDGRNITDVVVIANREAGGEKSITARYPNIRVHSILRASDILQGHTSSS